MGTLTHQRVPPRTTAYHAYHEGTRMLFCRPGTLGYPRVRPRTVAYRPAILLMKRVCFCPRHPVPTPGIIAMGRGGGTSLLTLVQHSTWRTEGRESLSFLPLSDTDPNEPKGKCSDRQGWPRPPHELRPCIHRSAGSTCY